MENLKKKISICIPCYNEENSIEEMYMRLNNVMSMYLQNYDYEIIFVDDFSDDLTRDKIRTLCKQDLKVKGVLNSKNFGFHRNVFESFKYGTGDCTFLIFGDLQDPPEKLPEFVAEWEKGYKCVIGQKVKTEEGWIITRFRKLYYNMIDILGEKKQIQFMNGFGLYDRTFVEALNQIDEVAPYFKTVISEYGMRVKIVQYNHSISKRGKSNFNFLKNYDFAMHGLTSSTKLLMRLSTFMAIGIGIISIFFALYVFIRKLFFWDTFPIGFATIFIGIFFLGAVQLFFIGVLGEYILSINERVTKKPRVIVEEKINFENKDTLY